MQTCALIGCLRLCLLATRGHCCNLTGSIAELQANDFERKEAVDKEPIWRVLLHNDDVHTFDYVIDTMVSVVKTVTRKKAHRITMEAHKSGLATVTTTWKQLAREYSIGLQKAGLTSSIAPDKTGAC